MPCPLLAIFDIYKNVTPLLPIKLFLIIQGHAFRQFVTFSIFIFLCLYIRKSPTTFWHIQKCALIWLIHSMTTAARWIFLCKISFSLLPFFPPSPPPFLFFFLIIWIWKEFPSLFFLFSSLLQTYIDSLRARSLWQQNGKILSFTFEEMAVQWRGRGGVWHWTVWQHHVIRATVAARKKQI